MRVFIYFIVGAFILSLVAGSVSMFLMSRQAPPKRSAQSQGLDNNITERPSVGPDALDVNSMAVAARITLDGNVEEITEGELNRQLRESEFFKRSGGKIPPQFRKFLYPQELERLVKQRLLTMKAESSSFDVTKDVDKQLNQFYSRMGGKEKLLKNPKFDEKELRKSITGSMKYQKLIQKIIGGREIGDDMLRQAYDVDKESKYKNEDGSYKPFESVKEELAKKLRSVVTDNDISSYYEQHKNRWKLPGKATLRRLMISYAEESVLKEVQFSKAKLETFYEQNTADYKGVKKYEVQHLFIDPASSEYNNAVLTDEEVKARYDKNIEDYRQEEQVKTASIFFSELEKEEKKTEDKTEGETSSGAEDKPENSADKAKGKTAGKTAAEKADLAFQRLLLGEEFASVAKDFTDESIGDEKFWSKGMKDKTVEETVFSLSVGGLSKPVKTSRGIQIFKLLEKKDSYILPLKDVEAEIKEQLKAEKAEAKVNTFLTELATKIGTRESIAGKDKTMTFADAVRKYSQAPSAKADKPGYIGRVVLGKNEGNEYISELGEGEYIDYAIRNLLKDGVAGIFDPVQSAKGYHLVQLISVIPAGIMPLEECSAKVEKDYRLYWAERNTLTHISEIAAEVEKGAITFEKAVEKSSDGSDKSLGGLWPDIELSAAVKPKVESAVLEESASNYGLSNKIINAVNETIEGQVSRPVKLADSYQLFFVVKKFIDEFEPLSNEIKDEIRFALNPSVPDSELKNKFNEDKEKYVVKAKVIVQHVMLASETMAEKVLTRAKAGEDFDKLVEAETIDYASKKRGGTLTQENTPKQIADAIKGLKAGEIAPKVINSGVGYHVLKLVKREEEKAPVFDDAKAAIEEELLRPKINTLLEDYVTEIKNVAVVEMWDGPENPLPQGDRYAKGTGLTLGSPDLKTDSDDTAVSGSNVSEENGTNATSGGDK